MLHPKPGHLCIEMTEDHGGGFGAARGCQRERGGQSRERGRMLPLVQLGGDVTTCKRVAHSRARQAEDLGERP